MRTNLKVLRVKHNLSQWEMADKIGVCRSTYSAIENGGRNGKQAFWQALQKAFNIPDADIWQLTKNEE